MLKYVDTLVTFSEIPDEITLCINISNCPCHCKGCHSSWLAEDMGEPLTIQVVDGFIKDNPGITCIGLMGGDSDPGEVDRLAEYIKSKGIKTAWYSGRDAVSSFIQYKNFNYIKLGPYIEEYGPLDSPTTNQRLYEINEDNLAIDITFKFWDKNGTEVF